MKDYVYERVLKNGNLLSEGMTIRKVAKITGVSKSTVHKDVTLLEKIDKDLFNNVRKVLDKNFMERTMRGGEATRKVYLARKLVM